jgi:DNA ligase-4
MDRKIKFGDVCSFFDRLQRTRTLANKKSLLLSYLNNWRQNDPDCYPLLRLFLPHLDDQRASFGLKEAKLADLYIYVLSLAKTSSDAYALRRFDQHHQTGKEDFADVLYGILKTRLFTEPSVSVQDVHGFLDQLGNPLVDNKMLFQELIGKLSPQEHKWFVRLILKQMHLSIPDQHILKCYHQDAPSLYNVCSSLQTVVKELWDPDKRVSGNVRLNAAYKPMLADRASLDDVFKDTDDFGLIVEEKLDGERCQLHYDHSTRQFKYFSRAGFDATARYEHSLTAFIADQFRESMILGGEMMVFDHDLQKYLSYDLVKTAASITDPDVHPVFIVFDILLFKGDSLIELPLRKRKEILERECPRVADRLTILPHTMMKSSKEVMDKLDDILLAHGEGLIVKQPQSKYEIGERSKQWIKVKPDYVDSCLDDLDLLVIGVFIGKGVMGRFGSLAGLLCACQGAADTGYLSFCKVGSGFNRDELGELSSCLLEHLVDTPSPSITYIDTPDKFVDLASCRLIVQVKGMTIVDSGAFAAGKTFRSPRFVTIRRDKNDVSSIREIEAMQALAMRSTTGSTKKRTFAESKLESPVKTELVSDLFKGELVYVHEGRDGLDKPALQEKVRSLNGIVVEHPIANIKHIVADGFEKPSLKLRNILAQYPGCRLHRIDEILALVKV